MSAQGYVLPFGDGPRPIYARRVAQTLLVDMLANVIASEDKDAIIYAFIAYKYVAKSFKFMMFGRVKKISNLLKGVLNEF